MVKSSNEKNSIPKRKQTTKKDWLFENKFKPISFSKKATKALEKIGKVKKEVKGKDISSQTKTMGHILEIYKDSGQGSMFCLWCKHPREGLSCISLHSQGNRGFDFILPRRECSRLLLLLQHFLRRKPLGVRTKARSRKSKGVVRSKTKVSKVVRKRLPRKDKSLH